jgi:dipeptidase
MVDPSSFNEGQTMTRIDAFIEVVKEKAKTRDWLPDPIGGLVWLGYDNPATTPHLPFYIGISQMPDGYMVDGRREFSRDCAWWAFRRASKLSYFRYQEMAPVLQAAWEPIEEEVFGRQASFEEEALALYRQNPQGLEAFLTEYSVDLANQVVEQWWDLGDQLWVRFNNRF